MTSITVDIDPWDYIDDIPEEEIAEYLRQCDWSVSKNNMPDPLDKFEVQFLMSMLDTSNWEQRRIYDKLLKAETD